ncbi:MAG: polyprenyl synthetase family protein [Lachnospirales bacterium]
MNNNLNDVQLKKVKDSLKEILEGSPKVLRSLMIDLNKATGKFMRATLIIETAIALEPKIASDDERFGKIVNIATAVELLHLATLIHDDVIDDAPIRRGYESTQSKYGKKLAVIAGDYLFTKCFTLISNNKLENMENFSKAVGVICVGEAYQLEHNMDFDIKFKEYKAIIAGKTAGLFALSMYCVGVELDCADEISERLGRAGYYLGMVFQMIDDCLDYDGDIDVVKKEVAKDLKEGVITYPLIHTFDKKPKLKKILKDDFSDDNIIKVIEEVKKAKGVEATKKLAEKYYDISKNKIINSVGEENSSNLIYILNKVYYRNS